jgi:hypothetical protein
MKNYCIKFLLLFSIIISQNIYAQIVFNQTYQANTEIENVWQTSDKGYIAGGYYQRWDNSINDWNYDHYILKTDSVGNTEWERNYDFTVLDGMCIEGSIVRELNNGGYVYISCINCAQNPPNPLSKYLLIRINNLGDTLWTKTYERPKRSMGQWVEPTYDGGFIMTGYAADFGTSADVYIVKADSMGKEKWNKTYQLYGEDQASCIRQTSDGGYIVAAGSVFAYPDVRTWLLKLDSNGDTMWTKIFPWGKWNVNTYLEITNDNGFIVAVKDSDYYQVAFKTDSMGNLIWVNNFGQGNACITQTADSGFAVFGLNYFTEINQNGSIIFTKSDTINPRFWQQSKDKGYITAKGNRLIKTDCEANFLFWDIINCPISSISTNIVDLEKEKGIEIYPNPSDGLVNIKAKHINQIEIYNYEGKLIMSKSKTNNLNNIDMRGQSSGFYFIKLIGTDFIDVRKIVIE